MVAQVKADYPYRKNVRAFKTGGEEEVGKSRKEERVRSKTGKASNDNQPIRSYQVKRSTADRKRANQVSPLPIDHVIISFASQSVGSRTFHHLPYEKIGVVWENFCVIRCL